jgi:hypothetical protein
MPMQLGDFLIVLDGTTASEHFDAEAAAEAIQLDGRGLSKDIAFDLAKGPTRI